MLLALSSRKSATTKAKEGKKGRSSNSNRTKKDVSGALQREHGCSKATQPTPTLHALTTQHNTTQHNTTQHNTSAYLCPFPQSTVQHESHRAVACATAALCPCHAKTAPSPPLRQTTLAWALRQTALACCQLWLAVPASCHSLAAVEVVEAVECLE